MSSRSAATAMSRPICLGSSSDLDLFEIAAHARKVGITKDEAAKIIQEAQAPKLTIVGKEGVKGR